MTNLLIDGQDNDSEGHKYIIQSRMNLIDELNKLSGRKVTQRITRASDEDDPTKNDVKINITLAQ